jgi:hypothetical protein
MRLIEVAPGMGRNAPRSVYKANAAAWGNEPPDAELEAIKNAIRAATVYAVMVVEVADAARPLASPTDFINGLDLPGSGYAIVQPAAAGRAGVKVTVLAKALGSATATPIKLPDGKSGSQAVAFYDDSVTIKTDFGARIDELCDDAICIAAVGSEGRVVPLWVPMTVVPA